MNTFRKFALSITALVMLASPAKAAPASYQPIASLTKLTDLGTSSPGILHADVLNIGKYDWYSASLPSVYAPQNVPCPGTINGTEYVAATGVATASCWVKQATAGLAPRASSYSAGHESYSWGIGSLNSQTTATNNIAVGSEGMTGCTSCIYNIGIGNYALNSATTTQGNIAIGWYSQQAITTGVAGNNGENTSVGNETLHFNQGNDNAAFAFWASQKNVTGNDNSCFGYSACQEDPSGSYRAIFGSQADEYGHGNDGNTCIGAFCLVGIPSPPPTGYYNFCGGYRCMSSYSTAVLDTAVGKSALDGITTGSYNFAGGAQAGSFIANGTTPNATSSHSIYIGYNAKAFSDGDTNEVVIGDQGTGAGSNTTTIGNASTTYTFLKGTTIGSESIRSQMAAGSAGPALTMYDLTATANARDWGFVNGGGSFLGYGQMGLQVSSAAAGNPLTDVLVTMWDKDGSMTHYGNLTLSGVSQAAKIGLIMTDTNSNAGARNWAVANGGGTNNPEYGMLAFLVSAAKGGDPMAGTFSLGIDNAGVMRLGTPSIAANSTATVTTGSLGPTGSACVVAKWRKIKDNTGVTLYQPLYSCS